MPTGYVWHMLEKDMSFEEFVWSCVRNFGVAVMQRDDPMGPMVPHLEPSKWNLEQLEEDEKRFAELKAMTRDQLLTVAEQEKRDEIDRLLKSKAEQDANNAKIDAMLSKVALWQPPNDDLRNLKNFMLEQLTASRDDYGYGEKINEARAKPIEQWAEQILGNLQWSIDYHRKSWLDEVKRTNERNDYLKALAESVPHPGTQAVPA